jgi:hypothetical protein
MAIEKLQGKQEIKEDMIQDAEGGKVINDDGNTEWEDIAHRVEQESPPSELIQQNNPGC